MTTEYQASISAVDNPQGMEWTPCHETAVETLIDALEGTGVGNTRAHIEELRETGTTRYDGDTYRVRTRTR